MTKEEAKILADFSAKVRIAILNLKKKSAENLELKSKIDALEVSLSESERDILMLKQELKKQEENYKKLQLSSMIEISHSDKQHAKLSIESLIKKIDKSLSMLNV